MKSSTLCGLNHQIHCRRMISSTPHVFMFPNNDKDMDTYFAGFSKA